MKTNTIRAWVLAVLAACLAIPAFAAEKEEKAPAKKEIKPGVHPEGARREAAAAVNELFETSFKAYVEGQVPLDRVITAQRMLLELETTRALALESTVVVYKKHVEMATKVYELVKSQHEAALTGKTEVDFVNANRLIMVYKLRKAEADLARVKKGGR